MNEQRNPNKRSRLFDDLRNSLFSGRVSISFEVNRGVSDRLDEILDELDELSDCLSDEMREEFTRAKMLELCLIALVDEYEKHKPDSLFVRVTEDFCPPSKNESDVESSK